ncbi:riboflavin kinase [candidate division CSSED10-310 bacterium]|uniref:riboflavin kinase n=1 Tax=candidate division CSSED10-310 bacterium TaxID=2855610 RepID=A0ABV6YSW0_UNCC1
MFFFLKRIRSERQFSGPHELIAQIKQDIGQAKIYFEMYEKNFGLTPAYAVSEAQ